MGLRGLEETPCQSERELARRGLSTGRDRLRPCRGGKPLRVDERDRRGVEDAAIDGPAPDPAHRAPLKDLKHEVGWRADLLRSSRGLEDDRMALEQRHLAGLQGPLVDADQEDRPGLRDDLVHMLKELDYAGRLVVDHEVLEPVEEDHGLPSARDVVQDYIREDVQVVRVDVVLAEGRRETNRAEAALVVG